MVDIYVLHQIRSIYTYISVDPALSCTIFSFVFSYIYTFYFAILPVFSIVSFEFVYSCQLLDKHRILFYKTEGLSKEDTSLS